MIRERFEPRTTLDTHDTFTFKGKRERRPLKYAAIDKKNRFPEIGCTHTTALPQEAQGTAVQRCIAAQERIARPTLDAASKYTPQIRG